MSFKKKIDNENQICNVECGITIKELNDKLKIHGLEMKGDHFEKNPLDFIIYNDS